MSVRESFAFQNPDLDTELRVDDLVARLSLEEKAAQLLHEAPAIDRLGIPAYNWWNECLHGVARAGVATVFPQAIALGAMWNVKLLRRIADIISDEARAKYHEFQRQEDHGMYKGLTFWAPNINIFRDPRWGRGHETYGECPYLTSRCGVALCQGLQGDDEKYLKVIATPKHFAAHSGPEDLRHNFNAVVSLKDLRETYLPAFHACVREGRAQSVMAAYNRTNGEACCASDLLLRKILRQEWQFEGYVVSDCWALKDLHENHGITDTAEQSAARAVQAGCDLNCGCTYESIPEAVKQGILSEAAVTQCVRRLFRARMQLGMFDPAESVPYAAIPYEVNTCAEHRQVAEQAARESLVLLKNNGLLPLPKNTSTIAVIGPNASNDDVLLANYFGTSVQTTTPLEGIRAAVSKNTRVLYTDGCQLTGTNTDGINRHGNLSEAVSIAQQADVVILCLGLSAELEGEQGDVGNSNLGGDKTDLKLSGLQQQLMESVVALGKPTALVLIAGSAIDLNWAHDNVDAILDTWYGGQEAGTALAKVLFGDYSPAGRLPITFPKSINDVPDFADYSMKGRTYRYAAATPLYPFGFGLSYSQFMYNNLECSTLSVDTATDIKVSIQVKNTGQMRSDEVVQLYVKSNTVSCDVPLFDLRGFERIDLQPGAEKRVHFILTPHALSLINSDGKRVLEPGAFTVFVGGSQPDERSVELTANQPLSVQVHVTGEPVALPY